MFESIPAAGALRVGTLRVGTLRVGTLRVGKERAVDSFTVAEARRLRLEAQGLGGRRWRGVAETVRGCGAVQAQDRMGEWLAVRARSVGLTAAAVERAQGEERSVARSWLMRGTLHLVAGADLRWMVGLLGAAMDRKALARRRNLGITAEVYAGAMAVMGAALSGGRVLKLAELVERVREAGLPWEGQVVPHLLRAASMNGMVCSGPRRGGANTYVLLDEWLGAEGDAPRDAAGELARRYFAAYGPASAADFRWWSGLPARESRAGFEAIRGELAEVEVEGRAAWMTGEALERSGEVLGEAAGRVRVLGAFDPCLLGYSKRELGVSAEALRRVHPGGGVISPTVLVDGVMVATWGRRRTAGGMRVTVEPLAGLSDGVRAGIDEEMGEIGRFLGEEVSWRVEAG